MVPAGPRRPDRADGRAAPGRPARLDRFLRELNGGAGGHPHRPRPARQRADPADALALRLDAAALPDPGRGPPRPARPSTTPRPTATPATTTSARSRPGTCSAPSASTRRCRGSGCWRSAARSSRGRDRLPHRRALILGRREKRSRQRQAAPPPGQRAQPGGGPYVQSLRLDGRPYAQPWTTYCALARGATLTFRLGRRPDRRWGARPPPRRPRSARTGRCRRAPARPERAHRFTLA